MKKDLMFKILIVQLTLLCCEISHGSSISDVNEMSSHILGEKQSDVGYKLENVTVPDCVEAGDLLFIDWKYDVGEDESTIWLNSGPHNDHSALYIGNNTFVDPREGGVIANDYYHFSIWEKNSVFVRVKTATDSQRTAAVEWAKNTIGLQYQDFFEFPWFGLKLANTALRFPTANKLYCMELLWAAYYTQGIDIDRNGWQFPLWVTAEDILLDDNVEVVYRNLNNSTGIARPNKGVYVFNKKMMVTASRTLIFGDVDIEAVSYNDKVNRVEFFLDNLFTSTDTTPPYTWRWNTHGSGKKVIKAVAYDEEGHSYYTAITVWRFF